MACPIGKCNFRLLDGAKPCRARRVPSEQPSGPRSALHQGCLITSRDFTVRDATSCEGFGVIVGRCVRRRRELACRAEGGGPGGAVIVRATRSGTDPPNSSFDVQALGTRPGAGEIRECAPRNERNQAAPGAPHPARVVAPRGKSGCSVAAQRHDGRLLLHQETLGTAQRPPPVAAIPSSDAHA